MEKKTEVEKKTEKVKRKSLFRTLMFLSFIVIIASSVAIISLAFNVQRTQLKKEAELTSREVITFNQWISNTPSAKNHIALIKELSQIHSENVPGSAFRVVGIHTPKTTQEFDLDALERFKTDDKLQHVYASEGKTYKYAEPLIITDKCLKCHGNYKAGGIAGIIAVDVTKAGLVSLIDIDDAPTFLAIFFAIAAAFFNLAWFDIRVTKPLGNINASLKDIREGKYDTRIDMIRSKDELGEIANTFNTTMDKITVLIHTDEERKQMQENIVKFLDILSSASDGDLRQRAEVTPDIFGSLGDAFNLMVDGLSDLIEKVKGSVEEVDSESNRMMKALQQLESGATSQMLQVKKATGSVNEAAMSASEITDKTNTAIEISENANTAIVSGSKAVESSIESVQLIRLTIQAINKRMKYLSERLMEIVTISHLISEIANRTNILAINASIEATRAGEQGKGFVVISDEIRNLAEKASKSTKQITEIITAVQTESAVVTKHLEEETKYVEIGTKMAADTEAAFREIEKTIKNMGVIISEINSSAKGQKNLTSDAVLSIEEVQMVSLQVLKLVQDFTEISTSLTETSNVMISSVERFKLPESSVEEL